jgi:hypothetical protein
MKRLLTIGLIALSAGTAGLAQAPAGDPIETPLLAAPANVRAQATVIKWKPDFTYDTLRQGSNKLVCYDRSGQPLQQPFSVECTSLSNLPRVAQNLKFEAVGDRAKANMAIEAAEKDGSRVKPEFGSVFYNLNGATRDQARGHMTVAVPNATMKTLGLPESGANGGAWIMSAGTTQAHLMIPGH